MPSYKRIHFQVIVYAKLGQDRLHSKSSKNKENKIDPQSTSDIVEIFSCLTTIVSDITDFIFQI